MNILSVSTANIPFRCGVVTIVAASLGLGVAAVDAAAVDVGAPSLRQSLSARAIGMGETGTADRSDPLNSLLNPALLPARDGVAGSYFHDQLLRSIIPDITLRGVNFAGMYQFDLGPSTVIAAGAQLRYARLGWPEVTVLSSPGAGTTYKPWEEYVGLTAAGEVRWQGGFSAGIGATAKRWRADYSGAVINADGTADAAAFDVGGIVSYTTTASSGWRTALAMGVGVVNLGSDFDDPTSFEPSGRSALPQQTNYGLSVRTASRKTEFLDTEVPEVALTFNAEWRDPQHEDDVSVFGLGGECAIMQVLFLRAGWQAPENSDHSIVQAGAGLGIPSRWFVVRLDYTAYPLEFVGGTASVDERDKKFTIVFGIPFRPE